MKATSTELCLPDFDLPGVPTMASAWHASVGQRVVEGDRLIEISAGDVAVDLSAPVSGVLMERCVAVDEPLVTGQVLARIRPD